MQRRIRIIFSAHCSFWWSQVFDVNIYVYYYYRYTTIMIFEICHIDGWIAICSLTNKWCTRSFFAAHAVVAIGLDFRKNTVHDRSRWVIFPKCKRTIRVVAVVSRFQWASAMPFMFIFWQRIYSICSEKTFSFHPLRSLSDQANSHRHRHHNRMPPSRILIFFFFCACLQHLWFYENLFMC